MNQPVIGQSKIISIDLSITFNPETFIGSGWSVEKQDEETQVLTEINLTKVKLESTLVKDEQNVKGEDRLVRLKEKKCIRLNARVFKYFWENQQFIPDKWKEKSNGITKVYFFDGTVLLDTLGKRCVLCLYWGNSLWEWSFNWLDRSFDVNNPSVVYIDNALV